MMEDIGKELTEFARAESEARLTFYCVKARNTFGLTPEERVALDIEYAIAEQAWLSAWTKLKMAKPIGWI